MNIGIRWSEDLGLEECPYLRRWVLNFGFFSIRLHHWLSGDDARYFHDHPWWFITFVIKGHYIDRSPQGNQEMSAGSIAFRPALHQHTVDVLKSTWTILICGPETRKWGFWVKSKFKKANKYFFENGHHPCNNEGDPVKTPTPQK